MIKYLLHYLLLLLPAILTGNLLIIAGDKSDGLKLCFLSLFGCFLFIFSKKYTSKTFLVIGTWIWWAIFWLHSIILSSSWILYNSSIDAYFVVQSIANTSLQESSEFIQQNHYFAWAILFLWLGGLAGYYYIYRRIDFEYIYPQASKKERKKIIPIILFLLTISAWIIKPIRALSPLYFGIIIIKKFRIFISKQSLIGNGKKNGCSMRKEISLIYLILLKSKVLLSFYPKV